MKCRPLHRMTAKDLHPEICSKELTTYKTAAFVSCQYLYSDVIHTLIVSVRMKLNEIGTNDCYFIEHHYYTR